MKSARETITGMKLHGQHRRFFMLYSRYREELLGLAWFRVLRQPHMTQTWTTYHIIRIQLCRVKMRQEAPRHYVERHWLTVLFPHPLTVQWVRTALSGAVVQLCRHMFWLRTSVAAKCTHVPCPGTVHVLAINTTRFLRPQKKSNQKHGSPTTKWPRLYVLLLDSPRDFLRIMLPWNYFKIVQETTRSWLVVGWTNVHYRPNPMLFGFSLLSF